MYFADRTDAGRRLADRLRGMPREGLVVLGLPRGGVPVAFEVAKELEVPLDVIVVRKLGVPFQPELAMGAIGEGDVRVLNERVMRAVGVSEVDLADVEAREREVLQRRAQRFRGSRARTPLGGATALIVDDGIATGSTVRAACHVARMQGARRVVVATPVAPPETVDALRADADDVIALYTPDQFFAIGEFYADFEQTSDEEVIRLLAWTPPASSSSPASGSLIRDEEVELQLGRARVGGHLTVPAGARGIVVFAHGSGSSRHSARNLYVASILVRAGLGTLLFDLLTPVEEQDRANVFDIALLADRLTEVTAWMREQPEGRGMPIGYFGASTGGGAALCAAAAPDARIAAVVSRGGRPDLAGARLGEVRAPTLLIVGGDDDVVLELNREAQALLRCDTRLSVVPGATHLFEEPGTLDAAAELARDWFLAHMS